MARLFLSIDLAATKRLIIRTLFLGSERFQPKSINSCLNIRQNRFVLILSQASAHYLQIRFSFRHLLQIKNLELRVSPSPFAKNVVHAIDLILQEHDRASLVARFKCDHAIEHSRTSKVGVLLTFGRNYCLRDCQVPTSEDEMDRHIQVANSCYAALNCPLHERKESVS